MKFLAVILLVAVIANSKVYGNSLECYQCSGDGCNSDAIETINCYDEVSTTAAPSTTTTTAGPTTSPPDSTTSSTTASSTVSTTASTASSTVSSTTVSSSTVTTTAGTTPTTEASSSTTPTSSSPTEASSTTQSSLSPTEASSTTQSSSSPTEASSTTVATGGLSQRYMKELSRRRRAADDIYKCYTMKYNDNGNTMTQKGCTKIVEGKDSCSEVVTPANTSLEGCEVCAEDKCNSSSAIQLSILAIVAALYVRFVM